MFACLKAFQPDLKDSKPWKFSVPSYRQDIESVWDVAEEVARYVGYDVIPSVSHMPMLPSTVTPLWTVTSEMKNIIDKLEMGDKLYFENIKGKWQGSEIIVLRSINLIVI